MLGCLGPAWGQPGASLGPAWGQPGPAWARLGRPGASLGQFGLSWSHFAAILETSGSHFQAILEKVGHPSGIFSDRTGLGTEALRRRFGTTNHMGFLSLALRV